MRRFTVVLACLAIVACDDSEPNTGGGNLFDTLNPNEPGVDDDAIDIDEPEDTADEADTGDYAALCTACVTDAECPGGICIDLGDEGSFCVPGCEDGCPDGFQCSGDRCEPDSGSCACRVGFEGKEQACGEKNEWGECIGTRTCNGADGWSECSVGAPTEEVCDGIDNNCDGLTDLLGQVGGRFRYEWGHRTGLGERECVMDWEVSGQADDDCPTCDLSFQLDYTFDSSSSWTVDEWCLSDDIDYQFGLAGSGDRVEVWYGLPYSS